MEEHTADTHLLAIPTSASGEKAKARDIIAAIRTLKAIEQEQRPATPDERQALARFGGFGPVALSIFPDPVTGRYKDAGWQALGEELAIAAVAARNTTAPNARPSTPSTPRPIVIAAMHEALARLGVPADRHRPRAGLRHREFHGACPGGMRFIGVELDSISGRIARVLHPQADIRIENFRDTRLPEGRIDAVIGNVPFADVKLEYGGRKLSLHDFFFAKSR